jgi:hypothetical protein
VIGKAGTGSDFRGLARYLLREQEGEEGRVAWTLVRNMPGEVEHAAALMDATAAQNVRVQKPVYHLSLSAAPGEELDREQWEKVVDRVLRDLGLEEHQALVVRHTDAKHDHVHVMVNRVDIENLRVWHNGHDYRRIEQSLRGIERDMGLREVPGRHGRLAGQERPERGTELTSGERREKERTGREAWAEHVKFRVYEDLKQAKSWAELERRLAGHRLRLEKRGPGLVVTDGRRQVKASRLYRGASYAQLEKRFGQSFDEWRAAKRELVAAVDRLEKVVAQRKELEWERIGAVQKYHDTAETRREHRWLRQEHWQLRSMVDTYVRSVFVREDVAGARRKLVRQAREVGWREAGRRLADKPRTFGRVRGLGLGPVRNAERDEALRAAGRVAIFAAQFAASRSARLALGPEAARAVVQAVRAERVIRRTEAALRRLPRRHELELEVGRKALAFGVSLAELALKPNALQVVKTALRTLELVQSAVRDRGMERER